MTGLVVIANGVNGVKGVNGVDFVKGSILVLWLICFRRLPWLQERLWC